MTTPTKTPAFTPAKPVEVDAPKQAAALTIDPNAAKDAKGVDAAISADVREKEAKFLAEQIREQNETIAANQKKIDDMNATLIAAEEARADRRLTSPEDVNSGEPAPVRRSIHISEIAKDGTLYTGRPEQIEHFV